MELPYDDELPRKEFKIPKTYKYDFKTDISYVFLMPKNRFVI